MNATAFGDKPQELITPEGLLFDAAERVGRIREGRLALHLHFSRLLPQNREDAKIRIAFRIFESMVDLFRGQLFLLSNSDIVLVCKDARLADLDAIVFKLRALFSKDPLTYAESADGTDRFVTFYQLETDYETFFAVCGRLLAEGKKRQQEQRNAPQAQSLDARNLGEVLDRIAHTDIAGVVRRQPCVRFSDQMTADVVFQEFYMSIADLQKALAPDVNILANRWLFQHLSQVLDLRVMSVLRDADFRRLPTAFSLNLNIESLDTVEFQQFAATIRGKAGLVVEFQLIDVFNNLDAFFRARDALRRDGHISVLDGMNSLALQFMDVELYETDFVKVNWSVDMTDDLQTAELVQALSPMGFDRVILGRCDSETAVAWGLGHGVRHFQGRFIDSMVAAVTMAQCDKSAPCSLKQCNARHGVISGRLRHDCGNNDMLDLFPTLRAPRTARGQ